MKYQCWATAEHARGRLILAVLLVVTGAVRADAPSATSQPALKRVLVVYSDERLLPANVIADEAIRKTFAADAGLRIEFHSEFLDVSRFAGDAHDQRQADFFAAKYAERPPDLIIAGGRPALSFLLNHRATLFEGRPIVFVGLTAQEIPPNISDPRVVGVPATPECTSTVELALHLQPQTDEIAIVAGVARGDVEFAEAARRELQPFEKRVRFRQLTNQSLAALEEELARLPDHTIVLYLSLFEDGAGNSFLPREALAQFAPASRVPIYGIFDTYIGYGIVGGSMITFEEMGRRAAQLAIRILNGEDPQAAAGGEKHQPVAMFDWRQLQRAGISEGQLPPGSVVRFQHYSIWRQYRWEIGVVASACILQSLLIISLVAQLRRRRRAEALRRESDERTRQAADAARESESRFLFTANAAPVLIWIAGTDKLCTFFNQPWLDFTGRTLEQELGNGWAEGVHRDDFDACLKTYTESFDARRPFAMDYRLRRHDGAYRWVSDNGIPRYDAHGNFLGYIGSCADITDRKQSEDKLQRALAELVAIKERLDKENAYLHQEMKVLHGHRDIVGKSPALQRVLAEVQQVAPTQSSVLLLGETGTGKELIARAIHDLSPRRDKQMVSVNCAAIPVTLIESELFGREKGAYTGAMTKQIGRFEAANDSTLFLDEVGELPPEVQVKLLRVLQEKEIERLGSPNPIHVDVRVIAATNRDLEQAVREGHFRQDLYYRLVVFPIRIPPLRERREDIPLLAWTFIEQFAKSMGKPIEGISKADLDALQQYHWPGNVRELRNVIERAMILATGTKLRIALPKSEAAPQMTLTLHDVEREHILSVLQLTLWRVQGKGGAAELLGMKRTTLESRMAKLGIHRPVDSVDSVD